MSIRTLTVRSTRDTRRMTYLGGYYWPDGDRGNGGLFKAAGEESTLRWIEVQQQAARCYADITRRARSSPHTVVCAGGNVGIMPRTYARHFQQVVTLEPVPLNWQCLLKNLEGDSNVRCINAALGQRASTGHIVHNTANCGASYLDPCNSEPGSVDVVELDCLELMTLDLLQLDVEGMEYFALQGAVNLIQQHCPVIVLEINSCTLRYGRTQGDIDEWLGQRGYTESKALQRGRDHVYLHGG